MCTVAQPDALTTVALDRLYSEYYTLDHQFSTSHETDYHQLWTYHAIKATCWLKDGTAAFQVVDDYTYWLLCQHFVALHRQRVNSYHMEPKLTAEEATNL